MVPRGRLRASLPSGVSERCRRLRTLPEKKPITPKRDRLRELRVPERCRRLRAADS